MSDDSRIHALAVAILEGDALLRDDGLYETVQEHEDGGGDTAILVDHLLALRAYDLALDLKS